MPRLPLHPEMAVEIRLKITFSIDLELNFYMAEIIIRATPG